MTFVGQSLARFGHIAAVGSRGTHTGSRSCCAVTTSTSPRARATRARTRLLEGLACGLPAAFLERRTPRAVGEGGLPFAPNPSFRRCSSVSSLSSTASARPSRRRPSPPSPTATSRFSGSTDGPRLESRGPWRTTCDARRTQRRSASPAASIARRSREPTTSSTRPTPGRRRRGSARRLLKNPLDLWIYQEILFEYPAGAHHRDRHLHRGGAPRACGPSSAGEVVWIDMEPVRDDYPQHPRITYLSGRWSRPTPRC